MLCANQTMVAAGLAATATRVAGAGRLGAVEPHRRGQQELRARAAQRRHAVRRRGQAGARRVRRRRCATCTRSRRRSTSTCRAAGRCCSKRSNATNALATTFFSRVRILLNAGASIPESLRARLAVLARRYAGREIPVVSAWGSTETAPMATAVWGARPASRETIGTPVPGVEIKLAPVEDRFELRVRGPSVTPGYWRNAGATAAAFDEDGFLQDRRRRRAARRERSVARYRVRRPARARISSSRPGRGSTPDCCGSTCSKPAHGAIDDVVFAGADRDELTRARVRPARASRRSRAAGARARGAGARTTRGIRRARPASRARSSPPSRRTPRAARSPTKARSTSGACWRTAPPT